MISVLTVTNRPEFRDWLAWNVAKQTTRPLEHVIVDGPGTVGAKRNEALRRARGEFVAWFDDDDWQHPERLARATDAIRLGFDGSACVTSWFLDLANSGRNRVAEYTETRFPLFNSVTLRRDLAPVFREDIKRASDSGWMRKVPTGRLAIEEPLFFWLSHSQNLSNPSRAKRFYDDESVLRKHFAAHWQDTDAQLAKLRGAL